MALFENFPYTNLHELNLDWVIKEIEDLKEGQVLSVNGQTGDVILYQDNDILFPAVTDSHWSMVRSADGTTRGIMFGNDDKAYIVHGSTMEQIYSASNQPPYPVESVNGKTGVVNLFTDNNGVVSFPAITDPDIEGIIIGRTLNNIPVYIQLNDDGTLGFTAGVNSNEIYTTKHTENNIIPVEEADTTETGTTNKQWGIVREVNSGDIGLMFNLGETPEVYIRYRDAGLNWQNVKLLTNDDIPSSSGVVSFNGQTGAVTATGSDLHISQNDSSTIENIYKQYTYKNNLTSSDDLNSINDGNYKVEAGSRPANYPSTLNGTVEQITVANGAQKFQTVTYADSGVVIVKKRRFFDTWGPWYIFAPNNIVEDTYASTISELLLNKYNLVKRFGPGTYFVAGGWGGHEYGMSIISIIDSTTAEIVFHGNADSWKCTILNNVPTSIKRFDTTDVT